MSIRSKLALLQQEIHDLKTVAQVRLIAVTKFASVAQMVEAYEAGIRDFGENKVQDALDKQAALPPEITQAVTWHFIGHLQSNKVNKVVGHFDWIHSVDSVELARKISRRAVELEITQKILLQVNIAQEPQKHGFLAETLCEMGPGSAMTEILSLPNLDLQGLMTMAPVADVFHDGNFSNMPPDMVFAKLRQLRDQISIQRSIALSEISMGMSQDFKHALQSGATMTRVGSYLFQP